MEHGFLPLGGPFITTVANGFGYVHNLGNEPIYCEFNQAMDSGEKIMTRAILHVAVDEDLLDRIETLVDKGELSKSEIVRRTLGYGIGEMEKAINRFVTTPLDAGVVCRCGEENIRFCPMHGKLITALNPFKEKST